MKTSDIFRKELFCSLLVSPASISGPGLNPTETHWLSLSTADLMSGLQGFLWGCTGDAALLSSCYSISEAALFSWYQLKCLQDLINIPWEAAQTEQYHYWFHRSIGEMIKTVTGIKTFQSQLGQAGALALQGCFEQSLAMLITSPPKVSLS